MHKLTISYRKDGIEHTLTVKFPNTTMTEAQQLAHEITLRTISDNPLATFTELSLKRI